MPPATETTHRISQNVNLKTIIGGIIVTLVGLGLIAASVQDATTFWNGHTTLQAFSRDIGSLLFMTSALTVLWELINRRAFLDEVIAKTNLSANIASSGVTFIVDQFQSPDIEWDSYFGESTELTLFAGYARSWRNNHQTDIERFLGRGGSLTVLLPDPGRVNLIAELARRYNQTPDEVKAFIAESVRNYCDLEGDRPGTVTVRFVDSTPQYSFYAFNRVIVFALYDHDRTRRTPVPTFVCVEKGSVYNFIRSDLQVLTNNSREHVPDPAK